VNNKKKQLKINKASESAIRYNDSRLLDYEEPLELKYNSFDYQNRDSYGKTYQPLMEKEV